MKFTLLCWALSVTSVLCFMNGEDAEDAEDTRFIVSVQADNGGGKHLCCGVFITLDFVLTAASCVENIQPQDLLIVAGTKKLSNTTERLQLKVDKMFSKEPSGENKVRNNIALLRIETVIPDSKLHKVHKIELASDDEDSVAEGKICKMFGWGQTELDVMVPTDILQMGSTEVKPLVVCKSLLEDIDEANICSQKVFVKLCNFDAGDPLISKSVNYLLGIATEHFRCNSKYYDVFTRVNSHKKWIWETVKANKKAPSSSSSTHPKAYTIITGTGIIVLLMILA